MSAVPQLQPSAQGGSPSLLTRRPITSDPACTAARSMTPCRLRPSSTSPAVSGVLPVLPAWPRCGAWCPSCGARCHPQPEGGYGRLPRTPEEGWQCGARWQRAWLACLARPATLRCLVPPTASGVGSGRLPCTPEDCLRRPKPTFTSPAVWPSGRPAGLPSYGARCPCSGARCHPRLAGGYGRPPPQHPGGGGVTMEERVEREPLRLHCLAAARGAPG